MPRTDDERAKRRSALLSDESLGLSDDREAVQQQMLQRIAALEDQLAVAMSAIAHVKGLSESASASVAWLCSNAPPQNPQFHAPHSPRPSATPQQRYTQYQQQQQQMAPSRRRTPPEDPSQPGSPRIAQTPLWRPPRQPPTASPSYPLNEPPLHPPRLHFLSALPTRLHDEILRFTELTDASLRSQGACRRHVFHAIACAARELWPMAEVCLYGSMRLGLCTASSDMDMVVLNAPPASISSLLQALHERLQSLAVVVASTALVHAEHPVLRLQCCTGSAASGDLMVDVDISVVVGYDHSGLQAVKHVLEEVEQQPVIRPLLIVLKSYLGLLGLNTTWTGGLASHAIFVLVRSYLLAAHAPSALGGLDLGEALVGLLQWYASVDFTRVQVCWDPAQPFAPRPPLAAARGYSPPVVVVQGHDGKNVAAKAYAMSAVVGALERAHGALASGGGLLDLGLEIGDFHHPTPVGHSYAPAAAPAAAPSWAPAGTSFAGHEHAAHEHAEGAPAHATGDAARGADAGEFQVLLPPSVMSARTVGATAEARREARSSADEGAKGAGDALGEHGRGHAASADESHASVGDPSAGDGRGAELSSLGTSRSGSTASPTSDKEEEELGRTGEPATSAAASARRCRKAGRRGASHGVPAEGVMLQSTFDEWRLLHESCVDRLRHELEEARQQARQSCDELREQMAEQRGQSEREASRFKSVLEATLRKCKAGEEAVGSHTATVTKEVCNMMKMYVHAKLKEMADRCDERFVRTDEPIAAAGKAVAIAA